MRWRSTTPSGLSGRSRPGEDPSCRRQEYCPERRVGQGRRSAPEQLAQLDRTEPDHRLVAYPNHGDGAESGVDQLVAGCGIVTDVPFHERNAVLREKAHRGVARRSAVVGENRYLLHVSPRWAPPPGSMHPWRSRIILRSVRRSPCRRTISSVIWESLASALRVIGPHSRVDFTPSMSSPCISRREKPRLFASFTNRSRSITSS